MTNLELKDTLNERIKTFGLGIEEYFQEITGHDEPLKYTIINITNSKILFKFTNNDNIEGMATFDCGSDFIKELKEEQE